MSMFYELMMRKKGMPKNYELVDYIQATGNQYIDTKVAGNTLYNYELEYQLIDSSSRVFICGVDKTFSSEALNFIRLANGNLSWYYGNSGSVLYNSSEYATTKNKIELIYDNNNNTVTTTVYNNNVNIGTATKTILEVYSGNIYLFAINRNGVATYDGTKRIYSAKFYNGTTLVRNFIPVYDTITQKYGMWESVQRKFYGNDGTGDFGGSIVGYTKVGSPTISADGVVSGFSSSNYLTLPIPNSLENNEVVMKVNFTDVNTVQRPIGYSIKNSAQGQGTMLSCGVYCQNGLLKWLVGKETSETTLYRIETTYALSTNTWYWIKTRTTDSSAILSISTDGINYTEVATMNNIPFSNMEYAKGYAIGGVLGNTLSSVFSGTIDLNETYIKLGNKLWFNGQQA